MGGELKGDQAAKIDEQYMGLLKGANQRSNLMASFIEQKRGSILRPFPTKNEMLQNTKQISALPITWTTRQMLCRCNYLS